MTKADKKNTKLNKSMIVRCFFSFFLLIIGKISQNPVLTRVSEAASLKAL
jgi:hypothetical protein